MNRHVILFLLLFVLAGCVTVSRGQVATHKLSDNITGPRELIFLNDSGYETEMSIALSSYGFKVRPIAATNYVKEKEGKNRTVEYKQAGAQYGVSVVTKFVDLCAFTSSDIYDFKLTLTDLSKNELVLILEQRGSDGPCTTVEPVFDTLAQAIAQNWQVEQ